MDTSRRCTLLAFALVVSMVLPSVAGNIDNTDIDPVEDYQPQPREYPNDWTHRPVLEVFTSLSCGPCMANSEPQVNTLYEEYVSEPGVPFTIVTFHQTNGGAGDDSTVNQDSKDRYNHYSPVGTPDGEIDGGWIQSQDYPESLAEAGQRSVKPANLNITQKWDGDQLVISSNIEYLGSSWSPDPTDPLGSGQDLVDGDVLNYELYFFVVEHQVVAYSSEEGAIVTTPFVSRATLGPYGGSLDAGEVIEHRDGWTVFTEQQHPNDGVVSLEPRIVPGNIEIVAVLYDTDDESKSPSGANPKAGVSRAINSATPRSTAFDAGNTLPTVAMVEEVSTGSDASITAFFDDEDGITTAVVMYNTVSANHTGDWGIAPMAISGSEICDEAGVCYAYGDASGDATIPVTDGDSLYYQVVFSDGKENFNTDEVRAFAGGSPVAGDVDGFSWVLWGGIFLLGILLSTAFAVWGSMPYKGSYFD